MKKAQQGSVATLSSINSNNVKARGPAAVLTRGYYDVLVQATARAPCNVAVRVYEDGTYACYTYSELFGVCEYIAQNLQQLHCTRGIIGLVSRRNVIVPAAIAAAHKCCTGFMFLDPAEEQPLPPELQFTAVLSVLRAPRDAVSQQLFKQPDRIVTLFNHTIAFYKYGPPNDEIYKQQHSFIMRTSGTTGEPKNVQVPIECIQPNIDDLKTLFEIVPEDVIYFSTPLTFDPSMVEILLACSTGASLLIAPDQADVLFPNAKEHSPHSVTVWQTTPSKFFQHSNADLTNVILSANSTLKVLALGGEPLIGIRRLKQCKSAANVTKMFALYGVTEMSCWACAAQLDLDKISNDGDVPLGPALSETQVVVQPPPGGRDKHQGNIILVSKTRQCIILNPNFSGAEQNCVKFVNTGDVGQVCNGTVYYRGRTDDNIKRFGHKINLLYIESVVSQCPAVAGCSCVWLPRPRTLVLYYCSQTITSQELADFLKCKLDEKHWPDKIIRIDNLPVTAHGKVSKQILSKLQESLPPSADSLRLKLLQELRFMFNASLTYDDIKQHTFAALGGTSFRAVALCNSICATDPAFGKLLLPHLLGHKATIHQMMSLAEQTLCKADALPPPPPKSPVAKPLTGRKGKRSASHAHSLSSSSAVERARASSPERALSPKRVAISDAARKHVEFVPLWTHNTGKCVDASPTLFESDLTLYVAVGSHSGRVVVLNGLYGELCGALELGARVEAAVHCFSDPAGVATGAVGAYDGTVVCFRLDTCAVRWRSSVRAMVKSKAVSCRSALLVAAYDGCVHSLHLQSGQVQQVIKLSELGICADLALAKGQYVLAGSLSGACASLQCHSPQASGSASAVLWRYALQSPVFAAPALYDRDKYVVFAEVAGDIHCRTVEKGIQIWKFCGAKGNIFSSLYIRETDGMRWQMTFGCHDNRVYCFHVKHSQPVLHWVCKLASPVYSTPIGINDTMVVAASNDGKLNVLSCDSGSVLAAHPLPNETFSSPALHRDYLYIGCRDDRLHALRVLTHT